MGILTGILEGLATLGEAMMNVYETSELEAIKKAEEILNRHGQNDLAENLKAVRFNAVTKTTSPISTTEPEPKKGVFSCDVTRSPFELKVDVENVLNAKFRRDNYTRTYQITRTVCAKPVINEEGGVSILFHTNEFTLKRIEDDKNCSNIKLNLYGRLVNANVKGVTSVYSDDIKDAIEKVITVIR